MARPEFPNGFVFSHDGHFGLEGGGVKREGGSPPPTVHSNTSLERAYTCSETPMHIEDSPRPGHCFWTPGKKREGGGHLGPWPPAADPATSEKCFSEKMKFTTEARSWRPI